MLYRVWVDGEDFGTMGTKAAHMFAEYHKQLHPDEEVRLEEVAGDAPVFLRQPDFHKDAFTLIWPALGSEPPTQ